MKHDLLTKLPRPRLSSLIAIICGLAVIYFALYPRLTYTNWKLVELMGQEVPSKEVEAYIILKGKRQQVFGNTGCNGIGGTYEIGTGNKLRLKDITATFMECFSLDGEEYNERHFLQTLGATDSYTISNGRLKLMQAGQPPSAVFVPDWPRSVQTYLIEMIKSMP